MATVQEVIRASLRTIGVIATGETPTAAEMADGLEALNLLLAEWSDAGLMIPFETWEAITLAVGQNSYTVGKSGAPDLNSVRPEQITGAFVRDAGNYDYPVRIIGEKAYRGFTSKTTQGRPDSLWYNATVPNGTVNVYPAADTLESLYICGAKPFTEAATLVEDLAGITEVPRNYHNALKWNLALELSPEYGTPLSQVVVARAKESYDAIVSLNAARRVQPSVIEVAGLTGGYNILVE